MATRVDVVDVVVVVAMWCCRRRRALAVEPAAPPTKAPQVELPGGSALLAEVDAVPHCGRRVVVEVVTVTSWSARLVSWSCSSVVVVVSSCRAPVHMNRRQTRARVKVRRATA